MATRIIRELASYDQRRKAYLEAGGYRLVRFTNGEVMNNFQGVFEVMRGLLGEPGNTPT